MKQIVAISEKFLLSTEEASDYFNIGINKLRRLIQNNMNAGWILWNGNRAYIKRKEFEKYLTGISNI